MLGKPRRLAVLAEGGFAPLDAQTPLGARRWGARGGGGAAPPGLPVSLGDAPEPARRAEAGGARLIDARRPPATRRGAAGRAARGGGGGGPPRGGAADGGG